MPQPPTYNRQTNFQNQQSLTPNEPLPADELDSELNSVKLTLDATLGNLALIQRDDGELSNETVGVDQLKPELAFVGTDIAEIGAARDAAVAAAITAEASEVTASAAAATATAAANTAQADAAAATIAAGTAAADAAAAGTSAFNAQILETNAATSAANAANSAADAAVQVANLIGTSVSSRGDRARNSYVHDAGRQDVRTRQLGADHFGCGAGSRHGYPALLPATLARRW